MQVLQCALWAQMSIMMMHIYFGVVDFKLTTNASQEIQSIGDSMVLYYPVENQNKFKELACVLHHAPMKWLLHANYMASLMTIVSSVCLSLQFSRLKTLYNYDWFFEMKTCIFWAQLFWSKTLAKEKLPQVTWWKKILGTINATPWWQMVASMLATSGPSWMSQR